MTIDFYHNQSDPRVINKKISDLVKQANGTIKSNCSVHNPTIDIKYDSALLNCNYAYIHDFGNYYYIRDIIVTNGQNISIELEIDYLMSFKDDILNWQGLVTKTGQQTAYLPTKPYAKQCTVDINIYETQVQMISIDYTGYHFIMQVAGGSNHD